MKKLPFRSLRVVLAALVLPLGCGTTTTLDPLPIVRQPRDASTPTPETSLDASTEMSPAALRYLPLEVGRRWTYDVTDEDGVSIKVTTVGELEPVGGTGPHREQLAFRATTRKDGGNDETVSWQAFEGNRAVRYREVAYDANTGEAELEEHWQPAKVRIDDAWALASPGDSFQEVYEETKAVGGTAETFSRVDTWTVLAVDAPVTVPAGTFDCLVLEKSGTSTKRYWFARGVGKVKEEGGQTEELVGYERLGEGQ